MNDKFYRYKNLDYSIPEKSLAWNMYAAGTENIGKNGEPESFLIPEPNADQLLVRVDAVGLCFSDVKLIKLGSQHAKLYNRDLKKEPTRVGHEASFTVIKVGKDLQDKYQQGQRLAIQPDIYQNQMSTAYGYTIPGGLIQYHLIGPEVLDADDGAFVLPVEEGIGYAEAALTEPWACVDAAYTQRRRLVPKTGGTLWLIGTPGDESTYSFSFGLDAPAKIFITNTPRSLKDLINHKKSENALVVEANDISPEEFDQFSQKQTNGEGFDDIVILAPENPDIVSQAARQIAFRGTLNIVGQTPLNGEVEIDAGRVHYHYTAFIGTSRTDISSAYGDARNRCELKAGGAALFIGAGGPMGQMHVQRAIEDRNGPELIIATEVNEHRLSVLESLFTPLAKANQKRFFGINPEKTGSLHDFIRKINNGNLADDAVVCVPVAQLMESAAKLLNPDGMLVFFAGVPVGTCIHMDLSPLFLNNMQLTGTSGSSLDDQKKVMQKTLVGKLNPSRSVAAVGGMEAAVDGLNAMMSGKYAGKILIFPQITNLPLIGLDELQRQYPQLAEKLSENNLWTVEAEQAMINSFWNGDHVDEN